MAVATAVIIRHEDQSPGDRGLVRVVRIQTANASTDWHDVDFPVGKTKTGTPAVELPPGVTCTATPLAGGRTRVTFVGTTTGAGGAFVARIHGRDGIYG